MEFVQSRYTFLLKVNINNMYNQMNQLCINRINILNFSKYDEIRNFVTYF